MKKIVSVLLLAVSLILSVSAAGCAETAGKSGTLVANAIEGVEKTEYVFCVSKLSQEANTFLSEINAVIKETDVSELIEKYTSETRIRRLDFLGEIFLEDNSDQNPFTVYTTVISPFQFSGAYGNGVDGVDMYLLALVAEKRNVKIVFNDLPYPAAYDSVKQGHGDYLAAGVALTDAVRSDFLVSNVYASGYQQIISDRNENYKKLSDLKGKKIGVLAGRPGQTLIKNSIANGVLKNSGAEAVEYMTDAEAYAAFQAEMCDVLVMDELPAELIVKSGNK